MAPREAPVYKEWSPWSGWITVVFWGTMILALIAVVTSGQEPHNERLAGAVILAVVAIGIHSLLAGLMVRLFRDEMELSLGRALPREEEGVDGPGERGSGAPPRRRNAAVRGQRPSPPTGGADPHGGGNAHRTLLRGRG